MSGQPDTLFCPLGALPADLKLAIFRVLPDTLSLRALVLTGSDMFKFFSYHASSICLAVLRNEIPSNILPEVIAAWSSSTINPRNKSQIRDFLEKYYANRVVLNRQSWTLSNALQVSKLHQRYRLFTKQSSISREAEGFERDIYRYILYSDLYRDRLSRQNDEERVEVTE